MLWPIVQLCYLWLAQPALLNAATGQDAAKPVVSWTTETDHNFGVMRQGRPQVYVFQFKNIHSDSIVLQTVRTSCGCTAADWSEKPIPPGASGEVRIEYDAYQNGDFDKKIRVFFDRQRKPEILRIRGKVES